MDVAGLACTAIEEVRRLQARFKNVANAPERIRNIYEQFTTIARHTEQVECILRNNSGALVKESSATFRENLESIHQCLGQTEPLLEDIFRIVFPSGVFRARAITGIRKITRANAISEKMNHAESQLKNASENLHWLFSKLLLALKIETRRLQPDTGLA